MQVRGKISNITRDWRTDKLIISFETDASPSEALENLMQEDDLDIKFDKHRKRRSLNANALLWECLGQIAAVLRTDKWTVYLTMLKRYGKYTYVCIPPGAVDMLKRQWRECEEIGEIDIHGRTAVQMLCYYGSSTYDSRQFSVLLDGVKSEMEELGLQPPPSEQMRRCIAMLEERDGTVPDSDSARIPQPK